MGKMKANRKFVEGKEAVSAVIGVILMVAITVAIAATVYVYVSGMLTTGTTKAPDISFTQNNVAKQLTVSSISASNIPWTDLTITASAGTVTYMTSGMVKTGQSINCTTYSTVGTTGYCNFTVSYKTTTLYGTYSFQK